MGEGPIRPIPGKEKVTEVEPAAGPNQGIEEEAPSKPFDISAGQGAEAGATAAPSPLDLAGQQMAQAAKEVNPETLQQQGDQLAKKSEEFTKLFDEKTYDALSDGQKGLLMAKADQYGQQMQGISKLTDGDFTAEKVEPGEAPSFKKIVGMLTSATNVLRQGGGVGALAGKKDMNTADMLRVQARILAADRTINFFTAVVGKFSDAIKTLGQTQL